MARTTDSKARTVAAAAALFRRQGYHGTGLNEILDAGGAPRGSLYFHFPGGKEEIGVAALQAAGAAVAARIASIVADAPDLRQFLRGFIATMAADLDRSQFQEGCPIATVALETAAQSAALADAAAGVFHAWEAELHKGLVRFGLPRERAAAVAPMILAQLEGALILARAYRSLEPIRLAERAVEMLAAGATD